MQKTPQANGAHIRSTLGPGRSTPLPINGSVLGLTKKEPERKGGEKNRRPGKAEGRATEGWTEGKAQIKIFTSMARCWGSRKPIEFFFINTNLKL
jgi:hypothetical protein